MTPKEFYDKVKAMRKAQRNYFRCRTQANLEASKAIEREIDKEIERVEGRLQPDLFNNQ